MENLRILRHVVAADGEGNDEAYVVGLAEVGKRFHLRGVERSEDDVAGVGVLLDERFANVGIDGHVPREDFRGNALSAQAVAGHQQAAVVFHHAPSVAIDIVQGQHHAHANRPLLHVAAVGLRLLLVFLGFEVGLRLLEGNEHETALLQPIIRLFHLRIGLFQLVER